MADCSSPAPTANTASSPATATRGRAAGRNRLHAARGDPHRDAQQRDVPGRADRVGSIVGGKQADLVVIAGDPSARISDIRNVELVFKQGVGYDPTKLIASVKGKVGLY
jgi:hypothetical protein